MTNREKYADEIKKYEGYNFCKDFVVPKVLKKKDCTGVVCTNCYMRQMLWLDEEYVEPVPEVDWSKVAVDAPILVRCFEEDEWNKRYFAKYEDGIVYAFNDGCTSWSENKSRPTGWSYAKLAEGEQ